MENIADDLLTRGRMRHEIEPRTELMRVVGRADTESDLFSGQPERR